MIAAQRRTVRIGICAVRRVLTEVKGDVDGGRLTHDARLTGCTRDPIRRANDLRIS